MAIPVSRWALIKCDYETGNFSIPDLRDKYEISTAAIDKRIAKERWEKGRLKEVVERNVQQRFIDAFAKRGFNETRVAEIIENMSEATAETKLGEVDDWQARDKAITQFAKLTGSYAVEKIRVKS